jgi:uncharacterized protein (TIGR02118 family)
MSIKLVVLYPQPLDESEFEQRYHNQHLPLMARALGSSERTRTYKARPALASTSLYRMAEVQFANLDELRAFGMSELGSEARRSAETVSTGGKPITLICEEDASSVFDEARVV